MAREFTVGASVDIDMGGNPITNVEDPTNDQDAATKKYVDDNVGGGGSPTGSAGGVLDGTYPNPGLAAGVAGSGLSESSDVLAVNVDGSTLEINSDALRVKADGITANEIAAGAVGASELASSGVSAATYGDSTHVGQFTVDVDGRITSASSVAVSPSGVAIIGTPELIYRYTVTGSDKASIDTGADTADAGSNDWTNGDLLEIWMLLQGDNAATVDVGVDLTFNNDTGANYDNQALSAVNTSVGGAGSIAQSSWAFNTKGQGGSTSYPSVHRISIPGYANTTFFKVGESETSRIDTTAANQRADIRALGYRSTSAITRAKIAARSTQKLKVGSQLLIYKRRNA